ncbi:MAG: hypothetical protein IJW13_02705 [Clostridia bacterium]|nr:hypothetical protein [Clostridia bacterium]
MRFKNFKNNFKRAFYEESPDLLDKIENSCKNQVQIAEDFKSTEKAAYDGRVGQSRFVNFVFNKWAKATLACVLCLALFASGVWLGVSINGKDAPINTEVYTKMYLDVNPGLQINFNEQNKVISCVASNADGQEIINELNLEGVELNTALSAVVGAIYVNGFISDNTNSILVSVDSSAEKTQEILSSVSQKINNVFKNSSINCSIIAQSVTTTDALEKQANQFNVSVGKMNLVNKMISGIDNLSEENLLDLTEMSINELNLIYSQRAHGEKDNVFAGDVVSGSVGGFLREEEALNSLLNEIKVQSTLLQDYLSFVEYEKVDGEFKLVYNLSIILIGEIVSYHFKVDCKTGEVLQFDINLG